jgi:aerobic carbon-monoxide dehydrogenase medium subunit
MYDVHYHRPSSLEDALNLLAGADEPKILAGGQTLLPTMKQHLAAPSDLVDVRKIPGMVGVKVEGGTLVIGAATTHAEVAGNPDVLKHVPSLACLAAGIGDPAVRHLGTIGGSIANNDPAADYPAAILALNATVLTNRREIPADHYFEGMFATALEDGEIITAVTISPPKRGAYAKFPNPASRYAMAGVYVAETSSGVRVAVTGAGESGVFRHEGLEAALSSNFAPEAADGVEISADGLLSDIHGDAAYRAQLVKIMAKRAVAAAA